MSEISKSIPFRSKEFDGTRIKTINARDLHKFLKSKQDFSTWIKKRIDTYEFKENKDFIVFHKKMENLRGGRPVIEYFLSIDMAKQICMVESSAAGNAARAYFIECEQELARITPRDKIEAVRAYLQELEAHEATKQLLTHEKQMAKLENGKSVYGASVKQVSLKTEEFYSWRPLLEWCVDNDVAPYTVYPNGYKTAQVKAYPAKAWLEVYDIDLFDFFSEEEITVLVD